uniref:Hipothetical protein n=1 Tax=Nyssomyia neivai TaxID=330878 RepID=A0A1L8DRF2_9DIPT
MKGKELKQLLTAESEFVSNLLLLCDVPDPDEDVLDTTDNPKSAKRMRLMLKKSPAELKAAADKKKEDFVKNRKTRNPKQKKDKTSRKETKLQIVKSPKMEVKHEVKEEREAKKFNEGEKIIFNKIDFDSTKKQKKGITNPTKALERLKETKARIRGMMDAGQTTEALEAKSQLSWRKAFEKNEGKKVKDNKFALKKSIDRREAQKKKSIKDWQERKKKVQGKIEARAKQVEENKKKKSQEKLKKKVKRLNKRGKIINI